MATGLNLLTLRRRCSFGPIDRCENPLEVSTGRSAADEVE